MGRIDKGEMYATNIDMRGVTDAVSDMEAAVGRLRDMIAENLARVCSTAERAYLLKHKECAVYTYSIDVENDLRSAEDRVQTTVWFCVSVSPERCAEDGWRPAAEVASAFIDLNMDRPSRISGAVADVVRKALSKESIRLAKEQVRYMLATLERDMKQVENEIENENKKKDDN